MSDQGRVLCQSHRRGLQCYGGGRGPEEENLCCFRLHSIRREQWMESSLDIANNLAVLSRGHTILVMQEAWRSYCLVQICVLDDSKIVVCVGRVQLWSRQKAGDMQWYWEFEVEPTSQHTQAGQLYGDDPVMHVVQLEDIWTSP